MLCGKNISSSSEKAIDYILSNREAYDTLDFLKSIASNIDL
jgi:hypothetical protein